jgi:hypothetical protein
VLGVEREFLGNQILRVVYYIFFLLYYIFNGYPNHFCRVGFDGMYVSGGLSELARGEWCLLWREWRARRRRSKTLSHGHHLQGYKSGTYLLALDRTTVSTNVGVAFRNNTQQYHVPNSPKNCSRVITTRQN